MPLTNYREMPLKFKGKDIYVGGFARPSEPEVFFTLKNVYEVSAVISLSGDYTDDFKSAGMDPRFYSHGPKVAVDDWYSAAFEETKRIQPEIYDAIYEAVSDAQAENKKTAIHCGAGDGRTGTALASLKLRELLEAAYIENPDDFDEEQEKTETMLMYSGVVKERGGEVSLTPFVKRAIKEVRNTSVIVQNGIKISGHKASVESRNDVESLILYERHLRKQLVLKNKPAPDEKSSAFSNLLPIDQEENFIVLPTNPTPFNPEHLHSPEVVFTMGTPEAIENSIHFQPLHDDKLNNILEKSSESNEDRLKQAFIKELLAHKEKCQKEAEWEGKPYNTFFWGAGEISATIKCSAIDAMISAVSATEPKNQSLEFSTQFIKALKDPQLDNIIKKYQTLPVVKEILKRSEENHDKEYVQNNCLNCAIQ